MTTFADPTATAPVADACPRERITVEGVVSSLLVRPLADVPTIEVRVSDATGTLPAVFLGRRTIPGIRLGTRLALTGMVSARGRHLAMVNPEYELLAD